MQSSEYKNIYQNEGSHFYYVGYHKIIISLLRKYIQANNKSLDILDAGCGTGLLTKKLEKFGRVQGIDISSEALKYAKKRGVKVRKASIVKLPFKDRSFDVIVSTDVIYHKSIPDDLKAFKELYRVLKPGGLLILKLPAFNFLYSSHDLMVHTKKRYKKNNLETELKRSHFKIIKTTYIGSFLFLPVLFKKIFSHRDIKPSSSVTKIASPINFLLTFLFSIENIVIQLVDLPIGISVLTVVRK